MKFIIRKATPEDVDAIVEFNAAMAFETERKQLDLDTLRKGVRGIFDKPARGAYFMADAGEAGVIGQTLITTEWSDWRDGDFWWIQSVYVRPAWRGKGVFKALYQHIADLARQEPDTCGLRLYVEKNNQTARQTYQKLGMILTHYDFFEIEF